MKVVAFNGSAREDGNTAVLLNLVLDELRKEGIETELVQLAGEPLGGCIACFQCFENKDRRCAGIEDDRLNDYIEKMLGADGMLLGSPTYFANLSAGMKALIERSGMVARANDDMFRRKVGAGVVAVRRAGATSVLSALNYFFLIGQMIVPGSSYWNLGVGLKPGEVMDDKEGVETMKTLGRNMAWLLSKLAG
jgi:multimeric flavodoxin WrbA